MENIFIEENYIKEEVKINVIWANVFAFIILAIAVVLFGIPFFMVWLRNVPVNGVINTAMSPQTMLINVAIGLSVLILGCVVHELIHGFFFALFADNRFKSIKFGILPADKLFTPYCHCKEKLRINHYRIGAIMPLVILGIVPAVISIITCNLLLLFFGIFFTMAAAGDILMFIKLMKEKKDTWIYDSPTEIGFDVYRKNN